MPRRLSTLLLASLAIAVGATGCGSSGDETELLAKSEANELLSLVADARTAVSEEECSAAERAVRELRTAVDDLPERRDAGLRSNLTEWVGHLDGRLGRDCRDQDTDTTTTTTPTTTTPSETAQPDTTATPEPTPTDTPKPTPTPAEEPKPDNDDGNDKDNGNGGGNGNGNGNGGIESDDGTPPDLGDDEGTGGAGF